MGKREEFVQLLDGQKLEKGDVIFLMLGDGVFRAPYAVRLFNERYAPLVALVGNANDKAYGSYPSEEVSAELFRHGLPKQRFLLEQVAPHTRAEAERAMELAKERDWKRILIVTSPHHQYRAFLTFLQAMTDASMKLRLINAVAPLSMTEETPWGKRADLLKQEFARIEQYQKKGDVASYKDGVKYLEQYE